MSKKIIWNVDGKMCAPTVVLYRRRYDERPTLTVRKPDGDIAVEADKGQKEISKMRLTVVPWDIDSIVDGVRYLMKSAELLILRRDTKNLVNLKVLKKILG